MIGVIRFERSFYVPIRPSCDTLRQLLRPVQLRTWLFA